MQSQFKIKDATRERCEIFHLSPGKIHEYSPVKLNVLPLIRQCNEIDFPIYFLVGWEMVEFIRPCEWSVKLFDQAYKAASMHKKGCKICLSKNHFPIYLKSLKSIIDQKMEKYLKKHPECNKKVMDQYIQAIMASQVSIRGAVDEEAVMRGRYVTNNLKSADLPPESTLKTLLKVGPKLGSIYDHEALTFMLVSALCDMLDDTFSKKDQKIILQTALFHNIDSHCLAEPTDKKRTCPSTLGVKEIQEAIEHHVPFYSDIVSLIEAHHGMLMEKNPFEDLEEKQANYFVVLQAACNIACLLRTTPKDQLLPLQDAFIKLEELYNQCHEDSFVTNLRAAIGT